jgi:LPXTG-motif cell wall-anchored protein
MTPRITRGSAILTVSAVVAALVLVIVPPAFAGQGEKSNSEAEITVDADCFSVEASSSKDISHVEIFFADGTFQEIDVNAPTYSQTFDQQIDHVIVKSGTTEVGDSAEGCGSTTGDGDEEVQGQTEEGPGKSSAQITVDVDCFSVHATSSKDISHVEIFFADGTFQEIDVNAPTYSQTFDQPIDRFVVKSGTTEVGADAPESCDAAGGDQITDDDGEVCDANPSMPGTQPCAEGSGEGAGDFPSDLDSGTLPSAPEAEDDSVLAGRIAAGEIAAQAGEAEAEAEARAGALPATGSGMPLLIVVALGLISAGLLLTRERRRSDS